MNDVLRAAYRRAEVAARGAASSFWRSFQLLPPDQRQGMCALYAFARAADDLVDGDAASGKDRHAALAALRSDLAAAWGGEISHPTLPALVDAARRFEIPPEFLTAIIDGVERDVDHRGFETRDELGEYCYLVAGAVGLACLHIWGCRDRAAYPAAIRLGEAFQWTNILRDLRADADAGRVYLPREDLRRFDYSADELQRGVADERFARLLCWEVAQTRTLFAAAAELAPRVPPPGRRMLRLMVRTYEALLARVERAGGGVLQRRVQLSPWQKLQLAAHGWWAASR